MLGQFDIQTQGTEHAQLHGLPHHRVLFEHLAGQHAGPHPRHFIFTGQGGLQGLDLLAQSLFYLLEGDTRIGSRCQRKSAIASLDAAVAGTGTGHQLLTAHQIGFDAGTHATVQHTGEHGQGVEVLLLFCSDQGRHVIEHVEGGHLHRHGQIQTPLASGRIDRLYWPRRGGTGGQIAEEAAHQRLYLIAGHVTGDHQGGIPRHIKAVIPAARLLRLQLGQQRTPADDRVGITGTRPGHRLEFFPGQGIGVVVGTGAALFQHHLQLPVKLVVVDLQVAQSLRFQFQRQRQPRRLVLLEIGGVVITGESIVTAPIAGHQFGEVPRSQSLGALEHHVLEHMGQTRFIGRFVDAAGLEPDHHGHHGCPVILTDQHFQAVIQGKGMGGQLGPGGQTPENGRQCHHELSHALSSLCRPRKLLPRERSVRIAARSLSGCCKPARQTQSLQEGAFYLSPAGSLSNSGCQHTGLLPCPCSLIAKEEARFTLFAIG